jgi:hypothetical protein
MSTTETNYNSIPTAEENKGKETSVNGNKQH